MFTHHRRALILALTTTLAVTSLAACSSGGDSGSSPVTLEMATTWTGERSAALTAVLADFTAETGVQVELVTPGDQYETVMKTRMASQDLPDVWETHGWAVARYAEYLAPLNDEEWVDRIDDAIRPIVTDDAGDLYALPLTMGINTISYSKDAFDAAGVDAADIRTWDDFAAAADQLLAAGISPIYVGNKNGDIAQLAEAIPPTFLTNEDAPDQQAGALLDGTFDFQEHWTPIAEHVLGWYQSGYFNVDILTADNEAGTKALGAGTAGMMFGGSNNIKSALTFYPEAELGLLPVPAATDEGQSSLSMGEGSVYGVWKDTDHPDETRALLDYLAQPETVAIIVEASGDLPGFSDVAEGGDAVTEYFRTAQAQFEGDLLYVPLFDREYLPSGMWDDLTVSLTQIVTSGDENGVESSVTTLSDAYAQKYVG